MKIHASGEDYLEAVLVQIGPFSIHCRKMFS